MSVKRPSYSSIPENVREVYTAADWIEDDDEDDYWQQLLLICGGRTSLLPAESSDADVASNPTDDLENETRRWEVSASWWLCKAFHRQINTSSVRFIAHEFATLLPFRKSGTTCGNRRFRPIRLDTAVAGRALMMSWLLKHITLKIYHETAKVLYLQCIASVVTFSCNK